MATRHDDIFNSSSASFTLAVSVPMSDWDASLIRNNAPRSASVSSRTGFNSSWMRAFTKSRITASTWVAQTLLFMGLLRLLHWYEIAPLNFTLDLLLRLYGCATGFFRNHHFLRLGWPLGLLLFGYFELIQV